MRKLYEIFKILKFHKRIVSAEKIRGNMVSEYSGIYILYALIYNIRLSRGFHVGHFLHPKGLKAFIN